MVVRAVTGAQRQPLFYKVGIVRQFIVGGTFNVVRSTKRKLIRKSRTASHFKSACKNQQFGWFRSSGFNIKMLTQRKQRPSECIYSIACEQTLEMRTGIVMRLSVRSSGTPWYFRIQNARYIQRHCCTICEFTVFFPITVKVTIAARLPLTSACLSKKIKVSFLVIQCQIVIHPFC